MAIDARELSAAIPEKMANANRWLLWRYVHREGKKKPDKVPFYVNGKMRTGTLDSEADQAQFGTLDKAIEECLFGWPDYDGIGFALGPDGTGNHWQGIDLDDLPDRPGLQPIASALPGYVEASPSGTGKHAIGYGQPFKNLNPNETGIEAYSEKRFFTVTGQDSNKAELCDLSGYVSTRLKPLHSPRDREQSQSMDWGMTDGQYRDLRSALASIPSDDRHTWIQVGHALKTSPDRGKGLWTEWSQKSEKYDPAEAERVWDSIKPQGDSFNSVFTLAERYGWDNPIKNPSSAGEFSDDGPLQRVDLAAPGRKQTEWIIDGIIPRGHVTLLSGNGGAGKSFLALAWAVHVATGHPWNGRTVAAGRTLVVSLEDDGHLVCNRLEKILEHVDGWLTVEELDLEVLDGSMGDGTLCSEGDNYRERSMKLTPAFHQIANASDGCSFIIIDNASDAFGGDENHRRSVRQFLTQLRILAAERNAAVLLLAHVDKNTAKYGGDKNSYSGSTAWNNSARSRLALVTKDGRTELTHEKCNLAPLADPVPMTWSADGVLAPANAQGTRNGIGGTVDADADAVLAAIKAAIERGENVNPSRQGNRTTWHVLESYPELPAWAKAKDRRSRDRFWDAITRLQDTKRIVREDYETRQRKWAVRFIIPTNGDCAGNGGQEELRIGADQAA